MALAAITCNTKRASRPKGVSLQSGGIPHELRSEVAASCDSVDWVFFSFTTVTSKGWRNCLRLTSHFVGRGKILL